MHQPGRRPAAESRLSVVITAMASAMAPAASSSRLAAVVMIPSPRGLVRIRKSPARAPALVITARGCTRPTTARPKIGSSVWIVWPPTTAMPASRALSAAPRRISARTSTGRRVGKPDEAEGGQGFPAHGVHVAQGVGRRDGAEVIGRSTIGVKKSVVNIRASRREPYTAASSAGGAADEHVWIGDLRQGGQQREQIAGRLLGRAPGPFGELSEADRVEVRHGPYLHEFRVACRGRQTWL